MTDKKPKRRAPNSYRPPRDKEDEFDARVAASGLSINGFLNDCVFGKNSRWPGEIKALALLLGRAAHIRDHLHEVLLSASDKEARVIKAAMDELTEIRAALLILMRRRP